MMDDDDEIALVSLFVYVCLAWLVKCIFRVDINFWPTFSFLKALARNLITGCLLLLLLSVERRLAYSGGGGGFVFRVLLLLLDD